MSRLTQTGKFLAVALVTAFIAGNTMAQAAAPASSTWKQNHPRRAEVNQRLANQNARIKNQVKDGDMSKAQAQQLHSNDKAIRQEERDMAKQNGGHITQQEQKTLNQQENANSKKIGN